MRTQPIKAVQAGSALIARVVFWLCLSTSILLVVGLLVSDRLQKVQVDQTVTLLPTWHVEDGDPVALELAAGLPFGTVLVAEGDKVEQGQTLMALDQDLLATAKTAAERQLLAARFERRCLIDAKVPASRVVEFVSDLDADTRDQLDAARSRCDQAISNEKQTLAAFDTGLAALETRLGQLDSRLALIFQSRAATTPEAQAQDALGVSLDRSRTEVVLSIQQRERLRVMKNLQRERDTRIKKLDALIEKTHLHRALLKKLESQPRIKAPRAGIVSRVRARSLGETATVPITYAVLSNVAQNDPELHAAVPKRLADRLSVDEPITLHLAQATIDGGQTLLAKITSISPMEPRLEGSPYRIQIGVAEQNLSLNPAALPAVQTATLQRSSSDLNDLVLAGLKEFKPFWQRDAATGFEEKQFPRPTP